MDNATILAKLIEQTENDTLQWSISEGNKERPTFETKYVQWTILTRSWGIEVCNDFSVNGLNRVNIKFSNTRAMSKLISVILDQQNRSGLRATFNNALIFK